MENKAGLVVKVMSLKSFMPETLVHCEDTNYHTSDNYLNNNSSNTTESHGVDLWPTNYENEEIEKKTNETNISEFHKYSNVSECEVDSFRPKVKLGNCSHTEEELSMLTEHCDQSLVKIGDTFDSRDAFREYINYKAKSWFYYYICRNSNQTIFEFNCICIGYNVKPREVVIRNKKLRTTACPCKIRLSTDQSTQKVRVYYVCNHHDHSVTEEAFDQYPHVKYLPHHVKEEFLDLVYLGCESHLVQNYIQSVAGVRITKANVRSYAYQLKKKSTVRTLTADRKKYINNLMLSIKSSYDTIIKNMVLYAEPEDCDDHEDQSTHTGLVVKVMSLKSFMPETLVHCEDTNYHTSDNYLNNNSSNTTESHGVDLWPTNYENEEIEKKTNETNISEFHKYSNVSECEVDSFRPKVKLGNCSHTEEELSMLTEHCDQSLVKIGDTFDSRDAFREYINYKAKSWFYYYICRNSNQTIFEFNCICIGYNVKPREVVIRNKKLRTTACPCKIRLSTDQSTQKVRVYYVCNHHDHSVTEEAFDQYPHVKYLPHHVKEEFLDLVYLGCESHLVQNYIQSVAGVRITKANVRSYAYQLKKKSTVRTLTADRKKYINNLMLSIKSSYDTIIKNMVLYAEPEDCDDHEDQSTHTEVCNVKLEKDINNREMKEKKSQDNSKKIENVEIVRKENDTIVTNTEIGVSILDCLPCTDSDVDNTQVTIQYVNEEGIPCDELGTPIATNNYENIPEINFSEGIYSHEDQSVLVENLDEEMYLTDWDPMHGTEELFVKTVTCQGDDYDETGEKLVSVNDDFIKDLRPYTKCNGNSNERDQKSTDGRCSTMVDRSMVGHSKESKSAVFRPVFRTVCNGHEHMTLLTDPDAILAGAKFETHAVFLSYVNERANRWFFYYSLLESGKTPEYYVYKCVYGQKRVAKSAYRSKGLRKRSNLEKTQCPCQIRLRRLEADPSCLTVLFSCNHHDHALDSEHFEVQPHSRRIPQHVKEEVKDLLSLGLTYDVLRKHVMAVTGHMIYDKYFHNVKAKMLRNNDQRSFTDEKLRAVYDKAKALKALYGNETETQGGRNRKRKIESYSQDYLQIDDVAEEVCICSDDS